jgi:signal transduction histidine kinase
VLVVLVAGVVLSLGLFGLVRHAERREILQRCAELTRNQLDQLHISILRSTEVLQSLAALEHASGGMERACFSEFVRSALGRQPELQALSWNPVVPHQQRPQREAEAGADGLAEFAFREWTSDGQLRRAGERPEYVPVYMIEPLEGNAAALGFDLNSDPCRRGALEQARDTGQPVATLPVRLAQAHGEEAGFLVLWPVYATANGSAPSTPPERRRALHGFAVAVFRVADLVSDVFQELKRRGIEARLHDDRPDGPLLYQSGEAGEAGGGAVTWLTVANRRWAIVFAPTPVFMAAHSRHQDWIVLWGGLAFTLLATGNIYGSWRRAAQIAAANEALAHEAQIRRQAEQAAASANAAKSDFLSSMSHEIRTPLNAILGYAQLMRRDRLLGPEQRDAVAGIHASGQHLLSLVNQVLDLAKIEAGRMELQPVDFQLPALAQGLAATFKLLCAQKRIGFRVAFDPADTGRVHGDEGKLRQVLINLLGNAVKFTQAGEVCLHFRPDGAGFWLFEVLDTGQGIPPEEQAVIFEPFHQGSGAQHQGGTGLGLAIARRQVELLGGTLALESERGIGSRFFFRIPLAASSEARLGNLPEASPGGHDPDSLPPLEAASVGVPDALCARLLVAAELHSSTALKAALPELRELGPEARVLAEHLRHRIRCFDMDGVQQLLSRCMVVRAHPAEAGSPLAHEVCGASGNPTR